jgi:hypothetical protein
MLQILRRLAESGVDLERLLVVVTGNDPSSNLPETLTDIGIGRKNVLIEDDLPMTTKRLAARLCRTDAPVGVAG